MYKNSSCLHTFANIWFYPVLLILAILWWYHIMVLTYVFLIRWLWALFHILFIFFCKVAVLTLLLLFKLGYLFISVWCNNYHLLIQITPKFSSLISKHLSHTDSETQELWSSLAERFWLRVSYRGCFQDVNWGWTVIWQLDWGLNNGSFT